MSQHLNQLLSKNQHDKNELVELLSVNSEETQTILDKALDIKALNVGRKVYLRGLIELSNVCSKNCYYCGIRAENKKVKRYTLTEEEVLHCADFAWRQGFGSLVIQTGEQSGQSFTALIEHLLIKIHQNTRHELSVTLSCGEQPYAVYRRWKDAGADRYLLRIETTNKALYYKIHPNDSNHLWETRIEALASLKQAGYQVGTGVMIGLPGQTLDDLANDLLFFRALDVDMVGMGPYIEHSDTPLYSSSHLLWPPEERFRMGLLMIALLRINMPLINIAASTALETLDPLGRQKGILAGANVVMPNLTPVNSRKNYQLYNNKPNLDKDASISTTNLSAAIADIGETICLSEPGHSLHFLNRIKS
ncbi:MAG: [FeFe] hydrogenase H-cluster radical SAM maturase HydE [Bacteroidetes bacterium HGW-Bacteroidetes-1]|jgi:biotin synthase|nr:MAG: [FeFe] hydrogenase H-cluster radical SAM maturase HydE [Bacteroidetes bacterium HGW-Bacteroidetes-1]